ncbi:MAG: histidinol dehydrogenase [Pseudomonadota bacterium]
MAIILDAKAPGFNAAFEDLVRRARGTVENVSDPVTGIIKDVRANGMDAVCRLTSQYDGFEASLERVRVSADEITAARGRLQSEIITALDNAAIRIKSFHEKQYPEGLRYKDNAGVELGWRWTPVQAAGLYAPGGRAAYPSSVLMNAIPARVAGVKRIVMCVPTPGGEDNDAVLTAASIAGVDEIWRIGGAQAIAAMAYGAINRSGNGAVGISPVDVIVGPGNAFVAEAKRQVFGTVGIDSIAGPSEILVVADNDNDPDWIAADLLSQAEHDPSSQAILITNDQVFANQVRECVERQIDASPRREIMAAAWGDNSAVIIVNSLDDAPSLIDRLAPEHLELATANPDGLLEKIQNAGAIFLGRYTPEALGDYVAGPNHVLPTSGAARYASGLSVLSFMKRTTIVRADATSLREVAADAICLAEVEGLPGHASSLKRRLN